MATRMRATVLALLVLLAPAPAPAQYAVVTNTVTSHSNLGISPLGDVVFTPTGADVYPGVGYTTNLGLINRKWLTIHGAELWIETLVAQNTIATIGGRILVLPTTILTADLNDGAGDTTLYSKYNNLVVGDRVYMEEDGKVEWLAVTAGPSGTGPYTYTVTRDLDGTGRNVWYAGTAIANTGTTGAGFIDLYSIRGVNAGGYGPAIVGMVRTGTIYSQIAPRWAIGNLNGLYGYGAEPDTYGAAFGNPSGTWLAIDNWWGVRGMTGTSTRFRIATDGSGYLADGNIAWTTDGTLTAGGWTIGTTALTSSAGTVGMSSAVTGGDDIRFWAGDATPGNAEFRVTEGGALTATNATISGTVTAASGTVHLDSEGITIDAGTAGSNRLKWSGVNSYVGVYNNGNGLDLVGATGLGLTAGGHTFWHDGGSFFGDSNDAYDLGQSSVRWRNAYVNQYYVGTTPGADASCGGGQYLDGETVINGIVTGGTCTDVPVVAPGEVAALRREVAELRAAVAGLLAERPQLQYPSRGGADGSRTVQRLVAGRRDVKGDGAPGRKSEVVPALAICHSAVGSQHRRDPNQRAGNRDLRPVGADKSGQQAKWRNGWRVTGGADRVVATADQEQNEQYNRVAQHR